MSTNKRFISIAFVVLAASIINGSWIFRQSVVKEPNGSRNQGGDNEGNVGVLLQTRSNNCGPTALQMVFNHYKIPCSVDEIERNVRMTENGTTMLALKQIADLKGLHAEGWRLTPEDFARSSFPLLLFVRNDHVVVADSICNEMVFLRDPAVGIVRMSTRSLSQAWRGEALVFNKK
ncbi:MAG: cysteine peptidase family C39 domain-containing protein [Bacteroidota bacterium]